MSREQDAQAETLDLGPPAEGISDDPLASGARIGRFVVVQRLGQGGMGVVVAAHDRHLDRTVALKLLRPRAFAGDLDSGRERLLREARAMAKLAHPNIVTVHETGTAGDQVFIAMEYARGGTLAAWLRKPRGWRDVLARFIQAGTGLSAAHRAGMVHRDFKPDNVLLMEPEGRRICVADFGLVGVNARMLSKDPSGDLQVPESASPRTTLVRTGAIVGTPAYMAPEQLRGGEVDERADQFAFCVSLWEGLYRSNPFAGDTTAELLRAIAAGALRPPPPDQDRQVPRWVRALLEKGLRVEPAERHASMAALLEALAHDPDQARRRRLRTMGIAAGGAAAAGLVAFALLGRAPAPLCESGPAELSAVWNDDLRAGARRAFEATGKSYAGDTFARAAARLDAYGRDWTAMRREACLATHARGTQSAAALDLRMACLDERLASMRAVVTVFTGLDDPRVVDRAVATAGGLESLDRCANVPLLSQVVPEPEDPATRARLAAARAMLAEADARERAGQYAAGLERAAAAVAEARAAGHAPLLAAALLRLGILDWRTGDFAAAESAMREAASAAAQGKDDLLAARILAELVFAVERQGRREEALALRPIVENALLRAGGNELLRSKLLINLAIALRGSGKLDAARDLLLQAIAIRERALGPDDLELASPWNNLGNVHGSQERWADAEAAFRRALAIWEKQLGPEHPDVAFALSNLGVVLSGRGAHAEAVPLYERALAIRMRTLEPDHPEIARTLTNLGNSLAQLGRVDEGLVDLRRALEMQERRLGGSHPDLGYTLTYLGMALARHGDRAEAAAALDRALGIVDKTGDADLAAAARAARAELE